MQPDNSQAALAQLQGVQASSQDPNTILANQQQQLGVNGAQQTVTGLRGAINNTTKLLQQVAPSVMGRTANSLVTNAQASKQVQNEQAPISANLTQEGTDYNQANQDLSQLQTQAQTAASGIYQGQQDKLSYAQNLYNALYKQEQDAQAAAEQKREFDIAQANSLKANTPSSFNLSGGTPSPTSTAQPTTTGQPTGNLTGGKSDQDAYNAVRGLLSTSNADLIKQTIDAIKASAARGNTYDQTKLTLLPQIVNSNATPTALRGVLNKTVVANAGTFANLPSF